MTLQLPQKKISPSVLSKNLCKQLLVPLHLCSHFSSQLCCFFTSFFHCIGGRRISHSHTHRHTHKRDFHHCFRVVCLNACPWHDTCQAHCHVPLLEQQRPAITDFINKSFPLHSGKQDNSNTTINQC